jgi:hypothetical protein
MVCARCGVKLKPQRWIYSTHKKRRYCPATELEACDQRAAKRKAEARCLASLEGERCKLSVGHNDRHDYEMTMER